jgi:hypothetical protein
MDLSDTLSAAQDTGIGPASNPLTEYFQGPDEVFGRPRCNCTTLSFPFMETRAPGSSQRLSIKVARASLVGSAPVWTTEQAVNLVPFNAQTPNLAGCGVMTSDLKGIIYGYLERLTDPRKFVLALSLRTAGVWVDQATPATPIPVLYTNNIDEADNVNNQHIYEQYWPADVGFTEQLGPSPADQSTVFIGLTGCLWTDVDELMCPPAPEPVFGPTRLSGGDASHPYVLNGCLIGVKRFKEC